MPTWASISAEKSLVLDVYNALNLQLLLLSPYSGHNRQPANQSIPPSAVTPFPLPSYDVFSGDVIKTEGDETKEPPPNYSPPTTPVPNEIPSYYWEPTSAL